MTLKFIFGKSKNINTLPQIFPLTPSAQFIYDHIMYQINQFHPSSEDCLKTEDFQRCLLLLLIPETKWAKHISISNMNSKDRQTLQWKCGIFLSGDHQSMIINNQVVISNIHYKSRSLTGEFNASGIFYISTIPYLLNVRQSTWLNLYIDTPIMSIIDKLVRSIYVLPLEFKNTLITMLDTNFMGLDHIFNWIKHLPTTAFTLNLSRKKPDDFQNPYLIPIITAPDQPQEFIDTSEFIPKFDIPAGTKIIVERIPHIFRYWALKEQVDGNDQGDDDGGNDDGGNDQGDDDGGYDQGDGNGGFGSGFNGGSGDIYNFQFIPD
jgi:hypothetical protein